MQGFYVYSPMYVVKHVSYPWLIEKWLKELDLDIFKCIKKMMIHGKKFHTKNMGEYETTNLDIPYRLIALMLNRIFG